MARTWQHRVQSRSEEQALVALLDAAGYIARQPWSGSGPGSYEVDVDVEPRRGSETVCVYVVEDPARPVIDRLAAAVGRTV